MNRPSMSLRAAWRPQNRFPRRRCFASVVTVAAVLFFSTPSWGGTCVSSTRSYQVTGPSTPADWSWTIQFVTSTVNAVGAGLFAGAPAPNIAAVFVGDINAVGVIATPPFSATDLGAGLFSITSCSELMVNGATVGFLLPVAFNPTIIKVSGPIAVPSIGAPGAIAIIALVGLGGRYMMRRRPQHARHARHELDEGRMS